MAYNFMHCKRCNLDIEANYIPGPFGPHEGKYVCPLCGLMLSWKKKEKNEAKRPKNRYTPESLGFDYCQLCMRPRIRLGDYETLDVHHVAEISKGGPDIPGNLWVVCTACHKLIHHQRTYLNEHISTLWGKYESLKEILKDANLSPEVYEKALNDIVEQLGA